MQSCLHPSTVRVGCLRSAELVSMEEGCPVAPETVPRRAPEHPLMVEKRSKNWEKTVKPFFANTKANNQGSQKLSDAVMHEDVEES